MTNKQEQRIDRQTDQQDADRTGIQTVLTDRQRDRLINKQAHRRAATETVARKLIDIPLHLVDVFIVKQMHTFTD